MSERALWASLDFPGDLDLPRLAIYGACGAEVFIVPNSIKPWMLGWDGEEGFDLADYEAVLARLLRRRPGAKLVLTVGMRSGAPVPWGRRHPDELARNSDGHRLDAPSLASAVWRKQSAEALARLVRHFESGPFADSVAGYLAVMVGENWRGAGEVRRDNPPSEVGLAFGDYSPAMREGFREWMRARGAAGAACDLPAPHERGADGSWLLTEPRESRGPRVADYFAFYHECNARLALAWAAAIKGATRRGALVLLPFGHVFEMPARCEYPQGWPHGAVRFVLDSPDVDFLVAPCDGFRRGRDGVWQSRLAAGSLRLRGKKWFAQLDTPTHVGAPPDGRLNAVWRAGTGGATGAVGAVHTGGGGARDLWQTRQLLLRDIGSALCEGGRILLSDRLEPVHGHWFHYNAWGPLAYDDESVQACVREILDAARGLDLDREGIEPDLALIVSPESAFHRALEPDFGKAYVEGLRQWTLPETGLLWEEFLLEDWPRLDRAFRLYIVPDALCVPAALRRAIRERLARERCAVLWFYAPGYFDEQAGELGHCRELTGLRLGRDDARDVIELRSCGRIPFESCGSRTGLSPLQPSPALAGWRKPAFSGALFAPCFFGDDPDAEVLGMLEGRGKPGLIRKESDGAVHWFSSAPGLTPALLRAIAVESGAHAFCGAGASVKGRGEFLCVTARTAGPLEIRLPGGGALTDRFGGDRRESGAAWEFRGGETRWFRREGSR